MFWADKIAAEVAGPQVINDSKTPSGRVHVGSLRGVIVHDTLYRALQRAGRPVRFLYGTDDYDALDSVPHYLEGDRFRPHLGKALCDVPAPDNTASDYAKYFMGEFLEVFERLGVRPEIYYLRDFYRTGKFDRHIDVFLRNAHLVRQAYWEVSKAKRPDNWYPFQPICENCGKIATTVVTDYNGQEVFYTCQDISYVQGCGHQGWQSPFGGRGKLPWKVEWVAKWDLLGVTMEWSGKDHSQKGGSRDVANAICRLVLGKEPPFHAPYEFILVNGTKMSSSKGVGASAKEIADLLPPEVLRFLMLRTPPRTAINFQPNQETLTRLFRDYHQAIEAARSPATAPEDLQPLRYAQLGDTLPTHPPFDFGTIVSLLQLPHLDLEVEIERRLGQPLRAADWQALRADIAAARKWLADYADEEEKLVLYLEKIPAKVQELSAAQKVYLAAVAEALAAGEWEGEAIQTQLFAVAKGQGLPPKEAFASIYACFTGKERGPKAGNLLSYLDRDFVLERLRAVSGAAKVAV
ncbi:MAG: lysine--tRNA ligase [Pseudanabaenaceae cyanobacterium]